QMARPTRVRSKPSRGMAARTVVLVEGEKCAKRMVDAGGRGDNCDCTARENATVDKTDGLH
ncbi:hypothetical protein, partial [Candidatus Accumulibacter sp. ACC012]|uniref:hypothetical protein n=1 Tax=Candidatus Accumulibacter sp. ACC012 TaxID=2823332 RepID=UPI0025C0A89C